MASSSSSTLFQPRVRSLLPDFVQQRIIQSYEDAERDKIELLSRAHSLTQHKFVEETQQKQNAIKFLEDLLRGQSQSGASNRRSLSLETMPLWNAAASSSSRFIPEKSHQIVKDGSQDSQPVLISSKNNNSRRAVAPVSQEVRECYTIMNKIDRFFRTAFQSVPLLDTGRHMISIIDDERFTGHCVWFPEEQVVHIGSFENKSIKRHFNSPISNLSIITHEFGHATNHFAADFEYLGESGALDEHMADVFAITHEHYVKEQRDASRPDTSWLIGESFLKNPNGQGTAIRSMSNPGKAFEGHEACGNDQQIAHTRDMDPREWTEDKDHDWGGVHVYSGIPNRAFYLAAKDIGGPSWEKPGKIWFKALLEAGKAAGENCANDNFAVFAHRTYQISRQQFGQEIGNAVARAWKEVGVSATESRQLPRERRFSSSVAQNAVRSISEHTPGSFSKPVRRRDRIGDGSKPVPSRIITNPSRQQRSCCSITTTVCGIALPIFAVAIWLYK